MDVLIIKKRISQIQKLPSFPRLIPEIIRLSGKPNVSMRDYEKVISQDPALMAQVLKIANSPFYGLSHRISNLRVALTMLGLQEIYRIVLSAGFYKTLHSIFDRLSYDFNIFWKHSQMTANAARFFAEKFYGNQIGEAYTAGLLHDVGKLVMEQFFQEEWLEAMVVFNQQNTNFLEAEKNIFGCSHADIGAMLLELWHIPPEICIPVKYHHFPSLAPSHQNLVNIVYFADKTAAACAIGVDQTNREHLDKDQTWNEMVTRHPHFNIIEKEKILEGLRELIAREIPVGQN